MCNTKKTMGYIQKVHIHVRLVDILLTTEVAIGSVL